MATTSRYKNIFVSKKNSQIVNLIVQIGSLGKSVEKLKGLINQINNQDELPLSLTI